MDTDKIKQTCFSFSPRMRRSSSSSSFTRRAYWASRPVFIPGIGTAGTLMLRLLKSSGGPGRCCSMADAPKARCAYKGVRMREERKETMFIRMRITSRVAMKILSRNCRSCSLRSFNIRSVASKRLFIEANSVFKDIFSFLSVEEDGSGPDGIKQNDPDKSSSWRERRRVRRASFLYSARE